MVAQEDTLIGPICHQLGLVAAQVDGVGTVYEKIPDAAPDSGGVMFACKHIDVISGTNSRLTLHLDFDIIHVFRRTRLQDDLARCYAAMPAWLTVLSKVSNVTLGGTVQLIDLKGMDIKEVTHANQKMMGVVSSVVVRYEMTIPR